MDPSDKAFALFSVSGVLHRMSYTKGESFYMSNGNISSHYLFLIILFFMDTFTDRQVIGSIKPVIWRVGYIMGNVPSAQHKHHVTDK